MKLILASSSLLFALALALPEAKPSATASSENCTPNTPKPQGPAECYQYFPDLKDKFKNYPCPGPSGVLKSLNDLERDYCGGRCGGYTCNLLRLLECGIVGVAQEAADAEQQAFCSAHQTGGACVHNSEDDAFHHCYWNARMTLDGGAGLATHFGQMHECGANRTDENGNFLTQPDVELHMDLHNNAVGRGVGEKARGLGAGWSSQPKRDYCRDECARLAIEGGLWVVDPQLRDPKHVPNFPYPDPTDDPLLIGW
ncbi:MAG: hypothetical protein M1813_009197 [Trichoglossum hirsutum]|nr:MAG: hypothetical protein M1813_009197 [Trichoglossum hirsutum]